MRTAAHGFAVPGAEAGRQRMGAHLPQTHMTHRFATLVTLILVARATTAQTPTDSTTTRADSVVTAASERATDVAQTVEGFRIRPIVSVGALYSSSRGIGIGGGFAADNIIGRADHLQVEGRVGQRILGAFGAYQTGVPERSTLFGLIGASVLTSSRFPYEGTSPESSPEGKLYLDRFEAEGEVRVAWQPLGLLGPLVQPFARYRTDRLRSYEEKRDGTLAFVSQEDRAELDSLTGDTRTGAALGIGVLSDSRDNDGRPTRGAFVQGEAYRFFSTDGSGLQFTRGEALAYLFRPAPFRLPLQPERGAVFVRLAAAVTRQDSGELPFFYQPVLERDLLVGWPTRAYVGRDALSVGVGARGVVIRNLMAFRVEGTVIGMLGAGYDDVFRQFTPRISTSNTAVEQGADVPLQPSFGVGLNLHYRDRERPLVGGLIGVGPGGITFTSFRLIVGLDRYLPTVR